MSAGVVSGRPSEDTEEAAAGAGPIERALVDAAVGAGDVRTRQAIFARFLAYFHCPIPPQGPSGVQDSQ